MPPLNAAIALSILFLGPEVVRRWRGETSFTIRHPWVVAFAFGLLHGFGFASGLTTMGLPQAEIPLALLLFNVGVEVGQLLFVALIVPAGARVPHAGDPLAPARRGAARVRRGVAGRLLDHSAHGRCCWRESDEPCPVPICALRTSRWSALWCSSPPSRRSRTSSPVRPRVPDRVAHPVSGLDHVLAMVAVGLWGAQLGPPALWLLPVTFPMVMAFGGFLGLVGIPLPGRRGRDRALGAAARADGGARSDSRRSRSRRCSSASSPSSTATRTARSCRPARAGSRTASGSSSRRAASTASASRSASSTGGRWDRSRSGSPAPRGRRGDRRSCGGHSHDAADHDRREARGVAIGAVGGALLPRAGRGTPGHHRSRARSTTASRTCS